jgi:DNA-nicking Smr family endonuclease
MGKRQSTGLEAAEISPADAAAFREAVRDVLPLPQIEPPAGMARPKRSTRLRKRTADHRDHLDESMPLIASASPDEAGAALSFQRAGVRTQVMRRLRRGLYPAEGELDLHGLTQTDARGGLADFLAASRASGVRCVRIIHGKGYRSGARGPILKSAVNLWLRRHSDVLAFVSAKAIDGGTGALYVLLRG